MNNNILPTPLSPEMQALQNCSAASSSDDGIQSTQKTEKVCFSVVSPDQITVVLKDPPVCDLVQQVKDSLYRELAPGLAKIDADRDNVWQYISALEARVDAVESYFERATKPHNAYEERLFKVPDTISDMNSSCPEAVEGLKQGIREWWYREALPDILEMHDEYDSVQRDIDDVNSRFDELEATLEAETDRIDAALAAEADRIDTAEEQYIARNKDHEEWLNKATEKISLLNDIVNECDIIVGELSFTVSKMGYDVEHMGNLARSNESCIIELEDKFRRVIDKGQANELISTVKEGLRAADNVKRFERRMTEFWPVLNELMRQMSSVSDKAKGWLKQDLY